MKDGFIKLVVFLCGASVMAFEIVGARILGVYVGTSVFVWTSIIGIILASLSLGYYIGGRIADKKPVFKILGLIILLSGISILISTLFKNPVLNFFSTSINDLKLVSILSSLVLFGIPAFLLGMVSPYVVRLQLHALDTSARIVGKLYAISTIGSITGTFLAGFVLIPFFNVSHIMYIISGLLVIIAILIFLVYDKK